jgi:outer membrane lipoprotein
MSKIVSLVASICLTAFLAACSVISKDIRSEALSPMRFQTLLQHADEYSGKTVILGGYIIDVQNRNAQTIMKVLQVPLRFGEEPDVNTKSQGRFIVVYDGFLDPEIYAKNSAITVAGTISGTVMEDVGDQPITYLNIQGREVYLWPGYEKNPPYFRPYPYHWYWPGYWYYPYP